MATREATTVWTGGGLAEGSGHTRLDTSKTAEFDVSWPARVAQSTNATSPEELVAAAHSSCFSMAFSNELTQAGYTPDRIQTTAIVTLDVQEGGATIRTSHLLVGATVPGISEEDFEAIAQKAKDGCPVSKALAGVTITIEASLG